MTFRKIKYHNKTIKYILVIPYRMRGLHASSSEVTCHQMIERTKEWNFPDVRYTPFTSNDMIFCVIVMNPNSVRK